MSKIIEKFNLKESPPNDKYAGTDKLYRGFLDWQSELEFDFDDWQKESDFCDHPYRIIWVNIIEMAIFTYCEGDLSLNVFDNRIEFYKKLVQMAEFYQNH